MNETLKNSLINLGIVVVSTIAGHASELGEPYSLYVAAGAAVVLGILRHFAPQAKGAVVKMMTKDK